MTSSLLAKLDVLPAASRWVAEDLRPMMRISEIGDSTTFFHILVEICTRLGADIVVDDRGEKPLVLLVVSSKGFGAATACREVRAMLAGRTPRAEQIFLRVYTELSADVVDIDALEITAAATSMALRQKREDSRR